MAARPAARGPRAAPRPRPPAARRLQDLQQQRAACQASGQRCLKSQPGHEAILEAPGGGNPHPCGEHWNGDAVRFN